jgi:prophage regulatory protein
MAEHPDPSPNYDPRVEKTDRIVRERECERRTGLSRSTRWRLEKQNEFPRRIRIAAKAVGWRFSEIELWLASRPEV